MAKETKQIIFRLDTTLTEKLTAERNEAPIMDIRTDNQFARKIVADFLLGNLVYLDKNLRTENPLLDQDSQA